MKCELIAALLHSPKVLFLDEPTIGLDVVMQKKYATLLRNTTGATRQQFYLPLLIWAMLRSYAAGF